MASGEDARRQEGLVQAGMVLASDLSLPSVLQKIVELACATADARYGALGVVGPDGRIAEFVTTGVTEHERRAIGHLPVGHGILGVLIHEATPLRLRRIQDDPRSVGFPPNHPPMGSFLGVPVSVRGRVYGNLYLTEKRGGPEFTEEDQEAVVTLAAQAAVAIENARLYEEARSTQRRLQAIADVTRATLEERPVEDVLGLIARSARELAGADLATVATPEDRDHLLIRVADGSRAKHLLGTRFPVQGSVSGEVMHTGRMLMVDDLATDPRDLQPVVRLGGMGSALFVPLAVGGRPLGTLTVANLRDGASIDPDHTELVESFAAQAAVALEYARARQELRRLAILEDRERIAKELHDGVIQSLFAVGMSLQAAEVMAEDPATVRSRIGTAISDIDGAIRDLRNYIFALRPGALADQQLGRALEGLAGDISERAGIPIEVAIDPDAAAALSGREADLLQAAREAVSNAVRHSGADRVRVLLRRSNGEVLLEVSDNGAGFAPQEALGRGDGLRNLVTRAEALGGTAEIDSQKGKGSSVRIRIPT